VAVVINKGGHRFGDNCFLKQNGHYDKHQVYRNTL
jgi:hypothetical protein